MNEIQYSVLKPIAQNSSATVSYVPYSVFSAQIKNCPSAFDLLSLLPSNYCKWQKEKIGGVWETCFWISPEGISALAEYEADKKRDIRDRLAITLSVFSLIIAFIALVKAW